MPSRSLDGPLVTVAIPTFNQEAYIAETLESVLRQDYPCLQILISDDASVDRTLEIAQRYGANFPDLISVHSHEHNLGATENVRSMLASIAGKYVCWFAGDDVMYPGKISAQVALLEDHPEAVMCYHDVSVMSEGEDLYRYNEDGPGQKAYAGAILEQLLRYRCFVSSCSVMARVSAAVGLSHRPEIKRASDWLYLTELAARGSVLYTDRVLAGYRRHSGNLSKVVDVQDEDLSYDILEELYPDYADAIRYGRSRLHLAYLFKYCVARNWPAARTMAAKLIARVAADPRRVPQMTESLRDLVVQRLHLLRRTRNVVR